MGTEDVTLFLATPSGGSQVHNEYMFGAIEAALRFDGPRGNVFPTIAPGLYVEHNRNILTALFLASGASHMLCVDTDIGWRASHVQSLIEAQKDVISGTYFWKQLGEPRVVGTPTGERKGDLERCNVVPGGFLLVTRKAILTLQAAMPEHFYAADGVGIVPALWAAEFQPGRECFRDDAAFSKHCLDAGVEMWIHHGVIVTHYGEVGFGPPPGTSARWGSYGNE